MRVVKQIALAVFLLSSLLGFAQIPSELACAAGSSDMESPTYNGTTQKTRSWLCVDATGHVSSPVFGAVGSGVTSFNTRTGAVVPVNTDYGTVGILGGVAVLPIQTVSGGAIQLGDNNVSGGDQLLLSSAGGAVLNDAAGDSLTIHGGTATFNTPITVTSCTGCTPATTSFTALSSGTNTTAAMICGTGCTLQTSGTGAIQSTLMSFAGLSSATNSTAAMIIGTGASMTTSGTGTITATNTATTLTMANSTTLAPVSGTSLLLQGSAGTQVQIADSAGDQLNLNTAAGGSGTVVGTTTGKLQGGSSTLTITTASGAVFNTTVSTGGNSLTASTGTFTGAVKGATYLTSSNCAVNSASPAACGSAPTGAVVIPTTTTTYTINTTAVTAASRIQITWLSFASNLPGSPTCVTPSVVTEPTVSAISAGTSFTIALSSTTGQTCPMFWIVN